jgi:lipopolysaccharide transport system permease protein
MTPSPSARVLVSEAPVRAPSFPREVLEALPTVLGNVLSRSTLLRALVWRDLKAKYQTSGLGYLWSLLNPLLMLLIYAWVFSSVLRVGGEDFVLFLASGLLPWIWMSESLSVGTGSIVANAGMLRRVYVPIEVLPIASVTSSFLHFCLSLPVLFGFLLAFDRAPQIQIAALPAIMGAQFCLTCGLVLITSTLNVRFRDLQYLVSNALLFLLFTAPVVYPIEQVPEQFRTWLRINPLTPLVVSYQDVLFHGRWPDWIGDVLPLWATSLVVLWVGAFVAQRLRWSLVEEL